MSALRPSFLAAWNRFTQVNINVDRVGDLIGGNVGVNIKSGIFKNACPIRMSYVLNYTGVLIPSGSRYATVSGKDKKQYMYRVNDMMDFLAKTFGKPDLTEKSPNPNVFSGKSGIILFQGNGWSDARGHVTLWNGTVCSDACHFIGSPGNNSFVPTVASLWILK